MSEADSILVDGVETSQPMIRSASMELSCETKIFALKIGKFTLMSENWFDYTSDSLPIFPSCCTSFFTIKRKLAEKQSAQEQDIWIFEIASSFGSFEHFRDKHNVRFINWNRYLIGKNGSRMFAEKVLTYRGQPFTFRASAEQLEAGSDFLNYDVLEFRMEFKMFKLCKSKMMTLPRSSCPPEDQTDTLEDLLKTQELSDFSIQTADETFKVHKVLLASRSPVFRKMLSADMKESKTNVLNLEMISAEAMRVFLRYIYTGRLEFQESSGTDLKITLFQLADQYQVTRLKALCELELIENLTAKSIFQTLEVADTYDAVNLRENSLAFVKLHKSSLVKEDEMASLVAHSKKLGRDILEAISGD